MTFFTDILKGIMIGIANIIPGVSGGTMAVSLGIYDKLIGSVSNLLKDWRSSVRTLLPLLIGCGDRHRRLHLRHRVPVKPSHLCDLYGFRRTDLRRTPCAVPGAS